MTSGQMFLISDLLALAGLAAMAAALADDSEAAQVFVEYVVVLVPAYLFGLHTGKMSVPR